MKDESSTLSASTRNENSVFHPEGGVFAFKLLHAMTKITQVSPELAVSYLDAGQGTLLVFLHAFPLSSEMWRGQTETFSAEYRVLCPDFRGVGSTSSFEGTPTIKTLAHDLALWLDELGIREKIALCSLSLGGYVALEFARAFPDKLSHLILADTRHDTDTPEGTKARDEMIEFAHGADGRAVAQKMLPKLLGPKTLTEKPAIALKVEQIASANDGEALAKLMMAIRDRRDSTDFLPSLSCPVLVIGGDSDIPSPPEVMAAMQSVIPKAKHVVIDDCGHLSNLEQPEAFDEALRKFLKEAK